MVVGSEHLLFPWGSVRNGVLALTYLATRAPLIYTPVYTSLADTSPAHRHTMITAKLAFPTWLAGLSFAVVQVVAGHDWL